MSVRFVIVDDQEPFRLAARMVVEVTDGFEVVGEAETGEDGVVGRSVTAAGQQWLEAKGRAALVAWLRQ